MACDSPFYVMPKGGFEKVPVPCGRCPPCKRRRVNSWVFRLLEEDKVSSSSHFVTITYSTNFVNITENGFMTLCKRDLQLYFKRLRKMCSGPIKYYAVGEYGTLNMRPHYHAIVFGVPDSKIFFDAWSSNGVSFGNVHVGGISSDSIAYTLKYIDKPSRVPIHDRDDRIKEFSVMSKGLGKSYLTDSVVAYHKADLSRSYVVKPGGHKIAIPRYYSNRIYDSSEKKVQSLLAQKASDDRLVSLRGEFDSLGYSDLDFDTWLVSKVYGRYTSFYSNIKNRDV